MLTILYSPHMASVDNEAKRASGHADVPLSASDRQQAQELGEHYAAQALDVIYCSDLQRALSTAQIAFVERKLPIVPDARLREYDYGEFTQFPVEQVEAEFPRRIAEPFPGGESLQMVVERMGAFLSDVLAQHDGKTILVIGHRGTRYALAYWCENRELEEIVRTPWEWRDIPIWRYELDADTLTKRTSAV